MRRYVVNRDSLADARKIREDFQDAPAERLTPMKWEWPKTLREVGRCAPAEGACMYSSNKWQRRVRDYVDYKHVGESEWRFYVRTGFLREQNSPSRRLRVYGPTVDLVHMPRAFAELAPVLGVQARLYDGVDEFGEGVLPDDSSEGFYQITISGAKLGAAKHPDTGETFIFVYDTSGVHCLITGTQLSVEKDGIAG